MSPLRVCESATPSLKQKSAVFHFLFLIVLACFVHLPSFRSVRSSAHENRGEGVTKKDNKKKHRKVFFLLFQPETLSFTYYLFPPFLFLLEDNSTHSTNIRFNTFLPSLIRVHACASNIQAMRERESFIVKCLVSKEDPFGEKGRENYKGSELRPCVNSHQFAFARSGPRQIRTNQQLLLRTLLHTLSLFLSFSHTLSLSHSHAQTTTNSNRKRKRERQQWYLWSTALSLSYTLCKVSVILVHPRTQKFVVCSLCQTPRLVQHERCLAGLYREELRRLSIKRKCTTTTGGGRIELWRTRKTKNRNENERVLFIPNKMILRPTLALRTWLFWTALGLWKWKTGFRINKICNNFDRPPPPPPRCRMFDTHMSCVHFCLSLFKLRVKSFLWLLSVYFWTWIQLNVAK